MKVEENIKEPMGWSLESFMYYAEMRHKLEHDFSTEMDVKNNELAVERDRRYSEGNELRAMALKIKETADNDAKILEREASTYRENRNDVLREQSLQNQGIYVTRADLADVMEGVNKTLATIGTFMSNHDGKDRGAQMNSTKLVGIITIGVVLMGIVSAIITNFGTL